MTTHNKQDRRTVRLDDNATWTVPDGDVMHALRYYGDLGPVERLHAAECMATLAHILTHPVGTEAVIVQLRQARRLLAQRRRHTACEGCNADATTQDSMGIPLCDACYDALEVEDEQGGDAP